MKRIVTGLCILVSLVLPLSLVPLAAAAQDCKNSAACQAACGGVGLVTGSGCGDNGVQFGNVLTAVVNLLLIIIGVVSVVVIMIAGFQFITSGGDSGKVATAKNTIIYAVIGLIVVALAEVIVHFVLGTVQG